MQVALAAPLPLRGKPIFLDIRWPLPGQWTYEDYLRLPDDGKRYEIIDGALYVSSAPSYDHQFTVSELLMQMGSFVKQRKLGVVLTAPFEIHLPKIANPVQPDVFFIAKERQLRSGDKCFRGAPDLVIEVISPNSVRTDRHIKFSAYERAGVREYWLIEPRSRFVEVYVRSPDTQEYALQGQFGPGEKISSLVLPELELEVDSIFVQIN